MTPPALYRQRAERFARLLDVGHESREHPSQLTNDEVGLATLGRRLATIEAPGKVGAEFRTNLRAMLVAAAERAGQEQTEVLPAPAPAPVGAGARFSAGLARARTLLGSSPEARRARTRGAIIAAVAASAIAVSGISTASESSVPGDALYVMKRSTERAALALAGTDVSKGELHLEFARARLGEAAAVRDDPAAFARLLAESDQETVAGVALLTAAAAKSAHAAPLDTVAGFLDRQRPALNRLDGTMSDGERIASSLALLERVRGRIEELRTTLPCGPGAAGPSDDLGPKPAGCTSGTGPTDAPRKRRTASRVTPSDGHEPAPAVTAGTLGTASVVLATILGPPGSANAPGKFTDR
jgi:hypothetical protein